MKKTTKRVASGVLVLLALVEPVACSSPVDVLDSANGLQGSKGETGRSWSSCDPIALAASGHTGDACGWADCDSAASCGGCGLTDSSSSCGNRSFVCDGSGELRASTTTILDCSGTVAPENPVGWAECGTALAQGATGDTCAGTWGCARATDDPCCVESAQCALGVPNISQPESSDRHLLRMRHCSESCQTLGRHAGAPATTCAAAAKAGLQAGAPCEGSFICGPDGDVSVGVADASNGFAGMFWCSAGTIEFTASPTPEGF